MNDPGKLIREALIHSRPVAIVLAGSNGAGKTTFHHRFLQPLELPFVNADELALQLIGTYASADDQASSLAAMHSAQEIRDDLVRNRRSFAMETVLSDPAGEKVRWLHGIQAAGYFLLFLHIRISSPELSAARVATRVCMGGHDVSDEKIHARFPRTQKNAREVLGFCDLGLVFDNSSQTHPHQLVEVWTLGMQQAQPGP